MTISLFEAFFLKKKIDLTGLMNGDAPLCKELMEHFEQMGGKSFDYSYKFLFNKLRRQYPLQG